MFEGGSNASHHTRSCSARRGESERGKGISGDVITLRRIESLHTSTSDQCYLPLSMSVSLLAVVGLGVLRKLNRPLVDSVRQDEDR